MGRFSLYTFNKMLFHVERRRTIERARAAELRVPRSTCLDSALVGVVVHVNQAEPFTEPMGPFKIVQQ